MARPLAACLVMAVGVSAARLTLAGLTPPLQLLVEIDRRRAAIYIGGHASHSSLRSSCNELPQTRDRPRSALATAP